MAVVLTKAPFQLDENTGKTDDEAGSKIMGDATVEDLMRRIIQKVAPPSQISQDAGDGVEAVLGIDIDGFHYSLICTPLRQPYHLSPREQEIVRLVAEGLPNKCISAVLEISSWTVATHLRRIFAKLGVSSRAAMVARFLEQGLREEEPKRF